tara:strand:+ start:1011 stop:1382 length:372 start_codon:yes stop_codon:yes gene_type:complete
VPIDVVGITTLISLTIFICWRYEDLAFRNYTFPSVLLTLTVPAILNLTLAYLLLKGSIWFAILALTELCSKLIRGLWWHLRPGPWPSEYAATHSLMSYWRHLMLDTAILTFAWLTVWVGSAYG